jgi:exonuclease SbcD
MKFFHLSDLHIGKQLHHYSLREDQEAVLDEIVAYADSIRPDAVVIAGDIYDRPVPSAEAVAVFDRFLTGLSKIVPSIPVLIISGNHDSADRLEYASDILKRHRIYLAGNVPRDASERLRKVTLSDNWGQVDFYLMPFLKPSYVRNVFEGEPPKTYTEAVEKLLMREGIDYKNRRNVLVSHQFYTGNISSTRSADNPVRGDKPELYPMTCDSETFCVGGIENVEIRAVQDFDYAALGHLHGAQNVGSPRIRYCGTLLKYSVSECSHEKTLTVVTLGEKGEEPLIELLPLHPLRDVKKKTGNLRDIIDHAGEDERGDYISVTLTDETDPYKPKEQLEKVFDHILEVRVDNLRTRKKLMELDEEMIMKDPLQNFADFYQEIQGKPLTDEEAEMMGRIFEQAKEGREE